MKDYFPTKLAQGVQFCNRVNEKGVLHENIDKCRHTVLIAPRRYGKSSLVFKVAEESKLPLAAIDLFLAHDDATITKRIMTGISQALSCIMPTEQKMLKKLQGIFNKFRISLTAAGFSIEASFETTALDHVDQIYSALHSLNELAKQKKEKIIIFIDEFQDIQEATSAKSIQGAIRSIAQETSSIVFIFSGNNRRLLLELFDEKSMPLYMLCDMIHLNRMSSKDYWSHLRKLSIQQWGMQLNENVFNKIMSITELHPYYVNLLCHELWKLKKPPEIDDIFDAWQHCYNTNEPRLIAELEKLTTKQQNILKALAINPSIEPTGHQFVSTAKTSASSINQIIKSLRSKDMIYKIKKLDDAIPQLKLNQIRVLDPLLAYALRKYA